MSALARGPAAVLVSLLALSGCETIEAKYGRKPLDVPQPVASQDPAVRNFAGDLKPEGVQAPGSGRPRDALVGEEYDFGPGYVVSAPGRARVGTDATGEEVSLNFVDANIREVVDITLAKTLGLNYVFDERVEGTVTARTTNPIDRADVLPMLENILALNGAALVESGGVYSVVPVANVPDLPKIVVTPNLVSQRPGIGIHVIPLRHASVASVQELVAPQISPGAQLAVDPSRNILIYTGPAAEARTIADMVSVLDVDVLAGMSFALFPLDATAAAEVVPELETLFSEPAVGDARGAVRFLPIERMNAVLAIARQPDHLRRVGRWVRRLDRADAGAGQRVYVYFARNSRAADLALVLGEVFDTAIAGGGGPPSPVAPGLAPVELFAQPVAAEGIDPAADGAQPAARIARPSAAPRPDAAPPGLRIVPDETRNALVIVGTEDQFRMVEAVLNRIDVLPLQVLIEATIAEVTLNDALRYGLQWAFQSGDLSGNFITNTAGVVGPAFPGFNLVLSASEVQVALSALSDITDIEVVSSPQLMVLDNQPAKLQVGDQVPVLTQQTTSIDAPGAPTVNSITYIDTGVILEVTPRVNASGLVTLEILQEVSSPIGTTTDIGSPTIQQRRIQSIVAVQSGETVALGGLIRERSEGSETGVPILQDIPVLGNLFKTTGQSRDRTELLVLITPRVIRGPSEARAVTDELRRRLTTLGDRIGLGG